VFFTLFFPFLFFPFLSFFRFLILACAGGAHQSEQEGFQIFDWQVWGHPDQ
jgi:hypothetical protein